MEISTNSLTTYHLSTSDLSKTGQQNQDSLSGSSKSADPQGNKLSASHQAQIAQLQQRDSEVRAHEAAHISAGGSVIRGGANFTYQEGPDGRLYAIGGEVPISTAGGSSPEETIEIAKQIQAGALAPANPSPQDLKVAATAVMMEAKARQELMIEKSALNKEAIGEYTQNSNDPLKYIDTYA